jgi:hypothetical protein
MNVSIVSLSMIKPYLQRFYHNHEEILQELQSLQHLLRIKAKSFDQISSIPSHTVYNIVVQPTLKKKVNVKRGFEDNTYQAFPLLQQVIPRGLSILVFHDTDDAVVIRGHHKFSSSDANNEDDVGVVTQMYSLVTEKNEPTQQTVVVTEKQNGKNALIRHVRHCDRDYLFGGSKNQHCLVPLMTTVSEMNQCLNQIQQRYYKGYNTLVVDILRSFSQDYYQNAETQQLMLHTLDQQQVVLVGEYNDGQHIVPLNKKQPELVFYSWVSHQFINVSPEVTSTTLCENPVVTLNHMQALGLRTTAHHIHTIYGDQNNVLQEYRYFRYLEDTAHYQQWLQRYAIYRNHLKHEYQNEKMDWSCYPHLLTNVEQLKEGYVLYYLDNDNEERVVAMEKLKTLEYILLRVLRETLRYHSKQLMDESSIIKIVKTWEKRVNQRSKDFLHLPQCVLNCWILYGSDLIRWLLSATTLGGKAIQFSESNPEQAVGFATTVKWFTRPDLLPVQWRHNNDNINDDKNDDDEKEEQINKQKWRNMVIMWQMLPGCGKSTLSRRIQKTLNNLSQVVCHVVDQDECPSGKVAFQKFRQHVEQATKNSQNNVILVARNNFNQDDAGRYIQTAEQAGFMTLYLTPIVGDINNINNNNENMIEYLYLSLVSCVQRGESTSKTKKFPSTVPEMLGIIMTFYTLTQPLSATCCDRSIRGLVHLNNQPITVPEFWRNELMGWVHDYNSKKNKKFGLFKYRSSCAGKLRQLLEQQPQQLQVLQKEQLPRMDLGTLTTQIVDVVDRFLKIGLNEKEINYLPLTTMEMSFNKSSKNGTIVQPLKALYTAWFLDTVPQEQLQHLVDMVHATLEKHGSKGQDYPVRVFHHVTVEFYGGKKSVDWMSIMTNSQFGPIELYITGVAWNQEIIGLEVEFSQPIIKEQIASQTPHITFAKAHKKIANVGTLTMMQNMDQCNYVSLQQPIILSNVTFGFVN